MKIRRSVFGFIVIALVLIALLFWYAGKREPKAMVTMVGETNAVSPVTSAKKMPTNPLAPSNMTFPAQPIANAVMPIQSDKGVQMKEDLSKMNDVPIVFYGRLTDQFGSGVVGAQITADVRIYNGVKSSVEHLKAVSDGIGLFTIQGGKGESLGIMPQKEGYVLAETNTYFKYSYMYPDHFSPDQNNPTVIRMWKLQGAEPLMGINQDYKLRYTPTSINFDLVAGRIVPIGGDVKITVNRSAGNVSEHNPQDWSIQVEAVDGGLIETTVAASRETYSAPQNGYEPYATFQMSTTTQSWHAAVDQMFSIESRKGRVYSKVRLIFGINDTPDGFMDVSFNGVANTNGSPNWEATVPQ